MRSVNTLQNAARLFCETDSGRQHFDICVWRQYADKIHPELADKCENDIKDYDFQKDVLPVIHYALRDRQRLLRLSGIYEKVIDTMEERLRVLFDQEPELDIILYLGLCSGAGWATTLGGKSVILLGAEKIIELDWDNENDMKALIFHELGHFWHKTFGQITFPASSQRERSILQLYQEGVAMVCEQILYGDDDYYHQDQNGWLTWCVEHEAEIGREFLLRLDRNAGTQDFFGDWCSFQGHSDAGYYLGCRLIKSLKSKYTLIEIANLPYASLWSAFKDYVLSLSEPS